MKCLGCHRQMVEKLEQTPRGPVYYDICEACGGIWFDTGEMDAMVLQVYRSVEASSRDQAKGVSERLRKCPRCEAQCMLKVFFLTYSSILLDHCDSCHGFWLDPGELKRINRNLAGLKSQGGGDLSRSTPDAKEPFLNPLDLIWLFFL